MAPPVRITTPIPTLEEFGEELGLSRSRRRTLAPVFVEHRADGEYVVRRQGNSKANHVFATQKEAVEKARELSPNRTILIERVRDGADGRDTRGIFLPQTSIRKWRKA